MNRHPMSVEQTSTTRGCPFVSVIMPVRNEEDGIQDSVASVLAQDYPPGCMELIVADGMSTDATPEILARMQRREPRLRVVKNPGRIMAKGFNIGVTHARGDIVLMMSGHSEMGPSYVSTCARLLQQGVADCVGGTVHAVAHGRQAEAIAAALTSRFGVGGVSFRLGAVEHKYVDTVAYGAYQRELLLKAGLLDEEFVRNQDDEFNHRLRKLGARLLLAPEIACRYHSRSSLRTLWRQYYQYGLWKVRVMQKHPRQMRVRHFVPALFVSVLAVLAVAACFSAAARVVLLGVSGAYLAASIGAALRIGLRSGRWRLSPIISLAFATLHFSYGIGFLAGMIRFRNRWAVSGAHGTARAEA